MSQMRRHGVVVEFKIITEHVQQVLFEPHDQWVNPGIKQDIGTLKTHLRAVSRGIVLHVCRR